MELTKEQLQLLSEQLFKRVVVAKGKVQNLASTVQNGLDVITIEDINYHQQLTQELINELVEINNEVIQLYNENVRLNYENNLKAQTRG